MKMTVFWDAAPYQFTDVSEVLAVSINRAMSDRPGGGGSKTPLKRR
jgi:hypothetical protein